MLKEKNLEMQVPVLDNEICWQAVASRDNALDGKFVYSVRSTGIYCRPSCPSRRPNRQHVAFFVTPDAAEVAGFRACKRCLPRQVEPQLAMVQQACRYIEANSEANLTLEALGTAVNVSPHHLQRVFKKVMGISPRHYAEACRLKNLKSRLQDGAEISAALYDVGYSSSSRLYERAPTQLGMTPATYRRGGLGLAISYTLATCRLGYLLVAATNTGICAVRLGDDAELLEGELRLEYSAADIQRDETGLSEAVATILAYLEGQSQPLDLPIAVQATAFQWRVWQELRAIPYGTTRSYSQVAEAIGQPNARRAVARACATNPVALLIPCHRVVRGDGDLGGYRWGIERKRQLLEQEKTNAS